MFGIHYGGAGSRRSAPPPKAAVPPDTNGSVLGFLSPKMSSRVHTSPPHVLWGSQNVKEDSFRTLAGKIKNSVNDIYEKLEEFTSDDDRKCITTLVQKLKWSVESFCNQFKQFGAEVSTELQGEFVHVVELISKLDEELFLLTAHIGYEENGEIKRKHYELVDLFSILNFDISSAKMDNNLKTEIHMQYVRSLLFKFERGEIPSNEYKKFERILNKVISEFKGSNAEDKRVVFMFECISEINNFLYVKNCSVDYSLIVNDEMTKGYLETKKMPEIFSRVGKFYFIEAAFNKIKCENLKVKTYNEYVTNLNKKFKSEEVHKD
ncbi:MAG: hypothetical protein V4591_05040, partial [Bdellovibrionota bacterium]